jgi:hypothetical protein
MYHAKENEHPKSMFFNAAMGVRTGEKQSVEQAQHASSPEGK